MSTTALHHELRGSGPPVVLLHHGIADSRVWDPQWQGYTERFRVLRLDLPGFGRSPVGSMPVVYARDVAELLDDLGIEDAAMVGASLGGRVALELGVARPDLVGSLVLVGAATSVVVVGDLDVDVIHEEGEMLRSTIPRARLETLPGTAHVPNLERPAAFDALVVPFLAEHAHAGAPPA